MELVSSPMSVNNEILTTVFWVYWSEYNAYGFNLYKITGEWVFSEKEIIG